MTYTTKSTIFSVVFGRKQMTNKSLATIEAEIEQTKNALENVKGTDTEVYARIVGYYRSVRNWNKGKRDEYNHRKQFVYGGDNVYVPTEADTSCACGGATPVINKTEASNLNCSNQEISYEFFARKTCPNCPPVKAYLANSPVLGTFVDVDTEEGLAIAAEKGVFAAPTVIIYDAKGMEIARAHSVAELSVLFEPVASAC